MRHCSINEFCDIVKYEVSSLKSSLGSRDLVRKACENRLGSAYVFDCLPWAWDFWYRKVPTGTWGESPLDVELQLKVRSWTTALSGYGPVTSCFSECFEKNCYHHDHALWYYHEYWWKWWVARQTGVLWVQYSGIIGYMQIALKGAVFVSPCCWDWS